MRDTGHIHNKVRNLEKTRNVIDQRRIKVAFDIENKGLKPDSAKYQQVAFTTLSAMQEAMQAFLPAGIVVLGTTETHRATFYPMVFEAILGKDDDPVLVNIAKSIGRGVDVDPAAVLYRTIEQIDFDTQLELFLRFGGLRKTGNIQDDFEHVCFISDSLALVRDMPKEKFYKNFSQQVVDFFSIDFLKYRELAKAQYGKRMKLPNEMDLILARTQPQPAASPRKKRTVLRPKITGPVADRFKQFAQFDDVEQTLPHRRQLPLPRFD